MVSNLCLGVVLVFHLNSLETESIFFIFLFCSKFEEIANLAWTTIHRRFSLGHSNILSLFDLILTLPASSAEVERGFSKLKLVKRYERSSLNEKNLNSTLAIKILSKPVGEFNPTPAIEHWNTTSLMPRRPTSKSETCILHTATTHFKVSNFITIFTINNKKYIFPKWILVLANQLHQQS